MRHIGAVALLLVIMTMPVAPASAQVREDRPNLIGGELLGRGVVLTANYERFFTNNFGIGAGLMALGASDGFAGVIPLYASAALGDVHAFYAATGATFVAGDFDDDFESDLLGTMSLGYQYHSTGGFFVRPLFTLLFGSGDFLLWPGLTIGGSF